MPEVGVGRWAASSASGRGLPVGSTHCGLGPRQDHHPLVRLEGAQSCRPTAVRRDMATLCQALRPPVPGAVSPLR